MTAPPLPMVYQGNGRFQTLGRALDLCGEHYGQGEVVMMAPVEERSEVTHRHQFAWLKEAWLNLPEGVAASYPSAEHLRKRALIETGWCTVQDYPCGTKTEAARWAEYLGRETDAYTLVVPSESVVRVFRARSQGRGKMKSADFQASKQAVLEWVSALIGVAPETLQNARAA